MIQIWQTIRITSAALMDQLWRAQFIRSSWEQPAPQPWWRESGPGMIDHDIGKVIVRISNRVGSQTL